MAFGLGTCHRKFKDQRSKLQVLVGFLSSYSLLADGLSGGSVLAARAEPFQLVELVVDLVIEGVGLVVVVFGGNLHLKSASGNELKIEVMINIFMMKG